MILKFDEFINEAAELKNPYENARKRITKYSRKSFQITTIEEFEYFFKFLLKLPDATKLGPITLKKGIKLVDPSTKILTKLDETYSGYILDGLDIKNKFTKLFVLFNTNKKSLEVYFYDNIDIYANGVQDTKSAIESFLLHTGSDYQKRFIDNKSTEVLKIANKEKVKTEEKPKSNYIDFKKIADDIDKADTWSKVHKILSASFNISEIDAWKLTHEIVDKSVSGWEEFLIKKFGTEKQKNEIAIPDFTESEIKDAILNYYNLKDSQIAKSSSHSYGYEPRFEINEKGAYIRFITGNTYNWSEGGTYTDRIISIRKKDNNEWIMYTHENTHENSYENKQIGKGYFDEKSFNSRIEALTYLINKYKIKKK